MTAARKPGRLLKSTLQSMVKVLNPLAPKLKSRRPAVVYQYLQKALAPQLRMSADSQRELSTLALASDQVLQGNLEGALEILLQRFKSIESSTAGVLSKDVAHNLELIPQLGVSSLSLAERNEAVSLQRKWMKLSSDGRRHSPSPHRGAVS